jgi:hypothetical protein
VSKDIVKVRDEFKWDHLLNQLIIKVELKDDLFPRNADLFPRNADLFPRNVRLPNVDQLEDVLLPRNVHLPRKDDQLEDVLLPRNVHLPRKDDHLPRNADHLPRNVHLPRNDQLEDVVQ